MKVKISRSRLCLATIVLGVAMLGISTDIQGAARKVRSTSRAVGKLSGVKSVESPAPARAPAAGLSTSAWMVRLKHVPGGGYPIFEPQVVDYRNDEPSRLRRAGLLEGAMPLPKGSGVLATGHTVCTPGACTFDIDCDDDNPCTNDTCNILPVGPICAGTCANAIVSAGSAGGCDDGLFCNGFETCDGGGSCVSGPAPTCCAGTADQTEAACSDTVASCSPESEVAGRRCVEDADCPGGVCDHCVSLCSTDDDCDDTIACNGIETCGGGICRAGVPPCGSGANCFEKRCIGAFFVTTCINADGCTGNQVCGNRICSGNEAACADDADCPTGQTCGPANVCKLGRCCPPDAEVDDDDTTPTVFEGCIPRTLADCSASGFNFFAGDDGEDSGTTGECGGKVPLQVGGSLQLGCPSYTSGIVQTSTALPVHPVIAGPMSFSEIPVPNPGGPGGADGLHRIGDDYCTASGQHVAVEAVRFVGAMAVPDAIFVEYWDNDGNFIEDTLFRPSLTMGVNTFFLTPPLVLPPCGRIAARTKLEFEPNARFVWASTAAANEGTNDANILFVNDDPNHDITVSGMLGGNPGVLSFEFAGRPVPEPRGGCCHLGSVTCTNQVKWICEEDGTCDAGTCVGSINAGATCTDNKDCTGVFQGIGSFCATCEGGSNAGAACQTCSGDKLCSGDGTTVCLTDGDCSVVGGTCDALLCDNDSDCATVGGTCVVNDNVCNQGVSTCSNNDETFCTTGADCPGIAARCSNSLTNCVNDPDCPGGTCSGAGSCEAGFCAILQACSTGACCATSGDCTVTSPGSCVGTFQGEGTTCEPNCCLQPAVVSCTNAAIDCTSDADCPAGGTCGPTGKDHCEDLVVNASNTIGVLEPNDPTVVLTFTGNNSLATAVADAAHPDGDSCFGIATTTGADRGWWECFRLTDTCTRVRIDLCCTTPTAFANWTFLALDCACNETVDRNLDPNIPELLSFARGAPFCDEDNLWSNHSFMGEGTYYYSIRSALEGALGPYTYHVVAAPCPDAACCAVDGNGNPFCVTKNVVECAALGGFFLGPPNKFPAIAICTSFPDPPTCGTGSCCLGPGVCEDEIAETAYDAAQCITDGGNFLGGVKCEGGLCALNTFISCDVGADCEDAGVGCPPNPAPCCVSAGGQRSLDQINPCPICEFESLQNCQPYESSGNGALADLGLGNGVLQADDFIPGTGFTELDRVCVWGFYSTKDQDAPADCSPLVVSDNFRVRVYKDSGFGLPGDLIGESTASGVKVETDDTEIAFTGSTPWGYQLALDTTIAGLVPDEVHWLEVVNDIAPGAACFWSWSLLIDTTISGNAHMAATSAPVGAYRPGGELRSDAAWCLPGIVTAPPTPIRPSCGCGGDCAEQTLLDAQASLNSFNVAAVDPASGAPLGCASFVCPTDGTPSNDDFGNALDVSVGFFTYETFCASTDGIPDVASDFSPDAPSPVVLDVWYRFVAKRDCTLRVDQCASGTIQTAGFDGILGVYTNGDTSCSFDPTNQADADAFRVHQSGNSWLSDEDCCASAPLGCAGFIEWPASDGQCFIIRAAAWGGGASTRGRGVIDISCGAPFCGDGAVQADLGEECDGTDVSGCAVDESCAPPDGQGGGCTCQPAFCGNNLREGSEECDGNDDSACPGGCNLACECVSTCPNDLAEPGEDCDGTDDSACPGRCQADCFCPPKFCGNDFKDPSEECDGTDSTDCPDGACRLPDDPAGGCTCVCEAISVPPAPVDPPGLGTCVGGACSCNADVRGSGGLPIVTDIIIVKDCITGFCGGCTNSCDVNCDGVVDFIDLGVVACEVQDPADLIDCCAEPVGACTDGPGDPGQCVITLESTCTPGGGAYAGDGTSCPNDSGERGGLPCASDVECNGGTCVNDRERCAGGPNDGALCTSDVECPPDVGICEFNAIVQEKRCKRRSREFDEPCATDADCPGLCLNSALHDRAIEIVLPPSSAGELTAYRISLVTLYDPGNPQPKDQPDFGTGNEGDVRYLNLLRAGACGGDPDLLCKVNADCNPMRANGPVQCELPDTVVTRCLSSPGLRTTYPCITVGCTPEFADWGALFGGVPAFVSGNAIIPDSVYTIAHLAATCTVANAATCTTASAEVAFETARYGDTESDGFVNVTDVVNTVDVVKQSPGSLFEYQVYVRDPHPAPQFETTNVTDIVLHVDALKLVSYVLPLDACP